MNHCYGVKHPSHPMSSHTLMGTWCNVTRHSPLVGPSFPTLSRVWTLSMPRVIQAFQGFLYCVALKTSQPFHLVVSGSHSYLCQHQRKNLPADGESCFTGKTEAMEGNVPRLTPRPPLSCPICAQFSSSPYHTDVTSDLLLRPHPPKVGYSGPFIHPQDLLLLITRGFPWPPHIK